MNRRFERCFAQGKTYERDCLKSWEDLGFRVMSIDTQDNIAQFRMVLRLMEDPTSKNVRYRPDAIVSNGTFTAYYDAKYARYIQKTAYIQYCRQVEIAPNFILCIKNPQSNDEYWVPLKKLILKFGSIMEAYPVDEEGWICLNEWGDQNSPYYNPTKYDELMKKGSASGNPCREFDFDAMMRYRVRNNTRKRIVIESIARGLIPPPEPNTAVEWAKLGDIEYARGYHQDAIIQYSFALKEDPFSENIWVKFGNLIRHLNDNDFVREINETTMIVQSNFADIFYAFGLLCEEKIKNDQKALEMFNISARLGHKEARDREYKLMILHGMA